MYLRVWISPFAGDVGARVAVDDHVRHVDADDVLRLELGGERPIGEHLPLAGERPDAADGVFVGDRERQHGVGHCAVRDLFVDGEHVAAPVTSGRHALGGVDDDLGTAARTLHRHDDVDRGVDVGRARTDRGSGQRRQVAVLDRLVEPGLRPLVAAEQTDEFAGGGAQLDIRRAALRASVDAVVETVVAGVDHGVAGVDDVVERRDGRIGQIGGIARGRRRCCSAVGGRIWMGAASGRRVARSRRREVRHVGTDVIESGSPGLRARGPCSWRRRSRPG